MLKEDAISAVLLGRFEVGSRDTVIMLIPLLYLLEHFERNQMPQFQILKISLCHTQHHRTHVKSQLNSCICH